MLRCSHWCCRGWQQSVKRVELVLKVDTVKLRIGLSQFLQAPIVGVARVALMMSKEICW